MKVIIDEDVCIGCQTCAEVCPEIFRMDELKEKAEVILPEVTTGGPLSCLEEALEACPVSCIHGEEE